VTEFNYLQSLSSVHLLLQLNARHYFCHSFFSDIVLLMHNSDFCVFHKLYIGGPPGPAAAPPAPGKHEMDK